MHSHTLSRKECRDTENCLRFVAQKAKRRAPGGESVPSGALPTRSRTFWRRIKPIESPWHIKGERLRPCARNRPFLGLPAVSLGPRGHLYFPWVSGGSRKT